MAELRGACARRILRTIATLVGVVGMASGAAHAQPICVGDCDGNGSVSINELIVGVNIALGGRDVSVCEAFNCQGAGVTVSCVIQGVRSDLNGCPGVTPTPTGGAEATPTVTGAAGGTPTATGGAQGTGTA